MMRGISKGEGARTIVLVHVILYYFSVVIEMVTVMVMVHVIMVIRNCFRIVRDYDYVDPGLV